MRSEYNCFLENFKIKIPQVTLIMLKPSEGHISNKEMTICLRQAAVVMFNVQEKIICWSTAVLSCLYITLFVKIWLSIRNKTYETTGILGKSLRHIIYRIYYAAYRQFRYLDLVYDEKFSKLKKAIFLISFMTYHISHIISDI